MKPLRWVVLASAGLAPLCGLPAQAAGLGVGSFGDAPEDEPAQTKFYGGLRFKF